MGCRDYGFTDLGFMVLGFRCEKWNRTRKMIWRLMI